MSFTGAVVSVRQIPSIPPASVAPLAVAVNTVLFVLALTPSASITKATLTVTANDASRAVGEPEPTFTVSYTGGDIVFIDSSHVLRPMGDVEFEFLHILPILPIRNIVVFPGTVMPLNVGRDKSRRLIEDVLPEKVDRLR